MGSRTVVWAGEERALGACERDLASAVIAPDVAVARVAWERLVAALGGMDAAVRWLTAGPPRRLLPELVERADELALPAPVAEAGRGAAAEAWGLNVRVLDAVGPVVERFAGAGIDVLAFKGLGLLGDPYPQHRLRPLGDADLLVRPRDARRAVDELARLGWQPRFPGWLPVTGGTAHTALDPRGPTVDLHWWPSGAMPHRWRGEPACWARARPAPAGHPLAGSGLLVPAREDHLVILGVHAASVLSAPSAHPWVDAHRLLRAGVDAAALAAAARAEVAEARTAELVDLVADLAGDSALRDVAPGGDPAQARAEERVRSAEARDARRPAGWRGPLVHRWGRWVQACGGLGPVDAAAVLASQLVASVRTDRSGPRA